jgi:hypothetical protein
LTAAHAHSTAATNAVTTGQSASTGCGPSARPLADISPTNEYRLATGQIEINKVRKKKPRPAPADAPRDANPAEKSVITTISSSASTVQIATAVNNGSSGADPKMPIVNAAHTAVLYTVATMSSPACERIFASTNPARETGLVSVRIAVPELRSPDTAPAPVITTAISTIWLRLLRY